MPREIKRELEEVPEDVKALFQTVQVSEPVENLHDGDYVAIYDEEERTGGRNELRWMRIGKYDEVTEQVLVEYLLRYDTSSEKLSAEMNFSGMEGNFRDGDLMHIPDNLYESARNSLYEIL